MKKIRIAILGFALALAALSVAPVFAEPVNVRMEEDFPALSVTENHSALLAYVAAPADSQTIQVTTQSSGFETVDNVVSEVSHSLKIPVDTVESIDEIVDTGTFYIKNPPSATGSVGEWISYVLAVIGFLFGVYHFLRRKYLSA